MTFPFSGREPLPVVQMWDYAYNTASGTVTALAGQGVLGKIFINDGGTLGLLTITDNTAASGSGRTISKFTPSVSGQSFEFNVRCRYGCAIFASAATNYTVTYAR